MRFRGRAPDNYRREEFKFEDGGTTLLDWFEPKDATPETPIVVIVHTLGGGTREPCTNHFAMATMKHGWRAVVANSRSCSGAPITSSRLYNAYETNDLHAIIEHVHKVFSPTAVFMIGFSIGATQSTLYCSRECHVDGVAVVSHVYDSVVAIGILESPPQNKLYLPIIVSKLTHAVHKNQFITDPNLKKAENAKTLSEFDDMFTSKNLGMRDHIEYYENLLINPNIPLFKAPTLIIGSDDDPFTSKTVQPIKEVMSSENAAMVCYPVGGHVSFLTGMDGKKSIVESIGLNWFDTILKEKMKK
ncbi:Clan SC, family S33, methylesterase-like serine peptidase [Histomonas meleagridis]|nr:Clan SC, family S33, methylesterase-like serine peptidase [Histomonas meleagridis]